MSIENVKQYLARWGRDKDVLEFPVSSATVELAAQAVGVIPARIAKTLTFKKEDGAIVLVTAGDARIDNKKFKAALGIKPKMLSPEEALELTGHAVGGICPFALKNPLPVYLDISMKRFNTVFPACGSSNSAIELTCDELFAYSGALDWVDTGKDWQEEA